MFQELSSCPLAMGAGKACIAHGLFPGNVIEAADASQAYTQAPFVGPATWVVLPEDQVPEHAKHIDRPVFRLTRALYGHPDSGGFWERHCEEQIFAAGFVGVPLWQSCYRHPRHQTHLAVYVEDFLMSAPTVGVK